jgi:predicted dehydrogenase
MIPSPSSRRRFLGQAATLGVGALVLPRHLVAGTAGKLPSRTLNIACIGIGGMGMSNMSQVLGENIVAVCDVDFAYVERSLEGRLRPRDGVVSEQALQLKAAYEKAAKFTDYRRLLEERSDIDAVIIATPDHLHAVQASAAMQLGKHVYVQKPLAWSVHESRHLARLASTTGVVTQMGNQGHSMEGSRRVVEIVRSGVLGPIEQVHVWTDRPVGYWAQGIPRPGSPVPAVRPPDPARPPQWNARTVEVAVLRAMAENPQTPPPGMDWDLYCGPAPLIPYHPAYHPFAWRGWVDFGVGSLGDMGAHLVDQAYWALGLTQPTSVTASASPWGGRPEQPATYPLATQVEYEFPAVGSRGPVKLFWYDGGLMPPRPPFLPDDQSLPLGDGGGGVFIGARGVLHYETYGKNPTVYPAHVAEEAAAVPVSLPRIATSHEGNWVAACKGEAEASSPFSYAAPLNETMLLGVVALRLGQGRKARYDAGAMQFTSHPELNAHLTREYRSGWSL